MLSLVVECVYPANRPPASDRLSLLSLSSLPGVFGLDSKAEIGHVRPILLDSCSLRKAEHAPLR